MKDYTTYSYHPVAEKLANILAQRTQNSRSKLYFRVLVSYYLAQMASSMRVNVLTKDRGTIPVNLYAIALAPSGFGKGHSTNIIEEEIVNQFKTKFMIETFPAIAEENLDLAASVKAVQMNTDKEDELNILNREFHSYGVMPYSFDSGTSPAFKQVRTKAQMAGVGSLNLIIDEIGTNLMGNTDLLAVYLETYDKGKIKQKLTKNTVENKRSEERDDAVPANMLLFGTPSKLLNGKREEEEFFSLLETGYARRCLFASANKLDGTKALTAKERFDLLTSSNTTADITAISDTFGLLADAINYGTNIELPDPVAISLIEYQMECEDLANSLPDHEEIRKTEILHRYFRALKLAGAYAFIDGAASISPATLQAAIRLIEESGSAFKTILTRDKPYVKLAKYLASRHDEVTLADMNEDLPFFKGSVSAKNDLLQLATAWGYKNNIVVKRYISDGIEFFQAESLKETDLHRMIISYSDHEAYRYKNDYAKFDDLTKLTQLPNMHWVNHHMKDNHRLEDNVIPTFNMIVLDVDGGTSIDTVELLMKQYKYLLYTTKRHRADANRFRVIIPMKYELILNKDDYKEFMDNIADWLPFKIDRSANQRSRKWLTHSGKEIKQDGELLDPLQFIPKTSKNNDRQQTQERLKDLSALERWCATQMNEGNRNNTMIKYALALLDDGLDYVSIEDKVLNFNNTLASPLSKNELEHTVLKSVASKIARYNN